MAALVGAADIVVQGTSARGQNWSPGVAVPRGAGGPFDHPAMAVDQTNGRFAGTVYVVASQSARTPSGKKVYPTSIVRSVDGGKSYLPPVQVLPNNFNNENGNPVVLDDGTLVVPFFEITVNGKWLEHPRLWVVRSEDGGASFSPPYLVTQQYTGHSFPVLACSHGHSPNRLYLVWVSKDPSGGENVHLSNSSDKGETWSLPVRVNESAGESNTAARIPTVAVDDSGTVGVTWIDRRAVPASKCSNMFFAASRDGGQSFLANVRISEAETCADAKGNQLPFGDGKTTVGERWEAGGDYFGLVAAGTTFHAVWADTRSGAYQLWHTTIRVGE
ncbi:MAG: sialidase family protein [Bryobacteraceae bacterium]